MKPYTRRNYSAPFPPPKPSAERERAVLLLRQLRSTYKELRAVLYTDKDWKKGLFPGALLMEDDSRFNYFCNDLIQAISETWENIGE